MTRVCLVALVLLIAHVAHAQVAAVSGIAREAGGAVLSGVTVELASPTGNERRVAVTSRAGEYAFSDVRPGSYTLRFMLPGFTPMTAPVTLTAGQSARFNAIMRVQVEESIQLPPRPPQGNRADRRCLHGDNETPAEAARRTEALAAVRLIDSVLHTGVQPRTYPTWEELRNSPAVAALRGTAGPVGDLARKIAWGAAEPLPGWGIAWLQGTPLRYALTDLRDPCAFVYSSEDPEVIDRTRDSFRIVPLS